ncbi:MAG TPA: PKD domain-containing protein [Bacteroidia bacterium]|nr:PKD domain-containing protein [Bacteroidia bacterium]
MKRLFLITLIYSLFFAGCKKDAPLEPLIENDPVFHFRGVVEGTTVNMNAGVDDYYMYASHFQNHTGIYAFVGDLKQINCADCNSIKIQINDSRKGYIADTTNNIDSLVVGRYAYEKDTVISTVRFSFSYGASDLPTAYSWDFGDGTGSTLDLPTHTYTKPGEYRVKFSINYANGCIAKQYRDVNTSPEACKAYMNVIPLSLDSFAFYGSASGNILSYNWNFGDSISNDNSSTLKNPIHVYHTPGIYNDQLTTIADDSCVSKINRNVNVGITDCVIWDILCNYPLDYYLSKITITYKDANGFSYYSNNTTQPADSYFEILSIDNYLLNEKGERTKQIHARFKCKLSNGSQSVTITDGDAVFAVSY